MKEDYEDSLPIQKNQVLILYWNVAILCQFISKISTSLWKLWKKICVCLGYCFSIIYETKSGSKSIQKRSKQRLLEFSFNYLYCLSLYFHWVFVLQGTVRWCSKIRANQAWRGDSLFGHLGSSRRGQCRRLHLSWTRWKSGKLSNIRIPALFCRCSWDWKVQWMFWFISISLVNGN